MFYLEKTILYAKLKYNEDHILCSLSHVDKIWHNIFGHFNYYAQVFLIRKRIRIMLGIGPWSSCRNWFKKLNILTVPSLRIFSLMMFVVNNSDSFHANSSIHCTNTQHKSQLHIPLVKYSSIQHGVTPLYLIVYQQAY